MWTSAAKTTCASGDSASTPTAPSCACVKPASNTTMKQQTVKVRPSVMSSQIRQKQQTPTNPELRVLLPSKPTCQHWQFGVSVALLAMADSRKVCRLGLEPLFHRPSTKGA